jgi:cyclohexanecarboxylate-CoA ligase
MQTAAARLAARTAPLVAAGYWTNESFATLLARQARSRPDHVALVDARRRLTWAELAHLAGRAAVGLWRLGLRPGDTLSFILPNQAEAAILFHAANRLGLLVNPIVPIYGARELRFILAETGSRAVVVPPVFRGVDFATLIERLRPDLPALEHCCVVGDDSFTRLLVSDDAPPAASDPSRASLVLYTSGTTAEPKGALHSDNTLVWESRSMAANHGLGADEVFVMPSPVGHISGLLYGVMLPAVLGATAVLMERWDAKEFCALVAREHGTFSAGATPFLQGVTELPQLEHWDLRSLRAFPCGGADVPPELIRQAQARLGVRSGRGYGSTEFPSITSSAGPDVPDERRAATDGRPIPPNEVEIRDSEGRPLPAGSAGEIWARGPELFLGYRNPALDVEAFDAAGFFRTGDLGVVDAGGWLTITGRVKDVIVRAGEKFSAKEIEDLLFEHPRVRSVAVVPVPDPRVGERACAVVVPTDPATPPTLAELNAFLATREVSRRKLPERLAIVQELPTTSSGKVQKHVLREWLARHRPEEDQE